MRVFLVFHKPYHCFGELLGIYKTFEEADAKVDNVWYNRNHGATTNMLYAKADLVIEERVL